MIEDNSTHRVLLEYIFINEFSINNIQFAIHGKEAQHILEESLNNKNPFDWIIVDYDIQFLNGLQIMTWYRQKCLQLGLAPTTTCLLSAYA